MSKGKKPEELKMMESVAGVMLSIIGTLTSLVRGLGGTFADFYRLATPEGEEDLTAIAAIIACGAKSAACSFADLIPEGWEVMEDVAPSTFDVGKLTLRSFLKQGESPIGGDEMRKRAVELKGNLGLTDGKRMLAEQDKIPVEFREFYIPLPGTVLRDSGGDLFVPYLYFHGVRWVLDFGWIGLDWYGLDRFACCE